METRPKRRYPLSLRYKLAVPVSLSVFLILVLLTHTTIRLVRDFVMEAFEGQVLTEVQKFVEEINAPFDAQDFEILQLRLDQLAARPDVYAARITDREGAAILRAPEDRDIPFLAPGFFGTQALFSYQSLAAILLQLEVIQLEERIRKFPSLIAVSLPLKRADKDLGTLHVFFHTLDINERIRKVYRERILFSFASALGIALLTAVLTWLAVRPLFLLRKTVQQILSGQTGARARIKTSDEIEALADAFNEMVSRLENTLKHLQARTEALEESQEKYRVLVENASDVIWMLSPEGEIAFMNRPFSGLRREDLLKDGLSLFLSFHTDDSIEKFESALRQVKTEKIDVTHLNTTYHDPKTKSEIFYSTNLTPVLTRAGEVKAIQAVTRDITDLKRVEVMKDRLIRDVAHELKTPVAKFQMTLTWLEKEFRNTNAKPLYRSLTDLMKRNSDLLMTMIMEIMNLSRLEAGTEPMEKKSFDLNQILARVCDDVEPLAMERKLNLQRRFFSGTLPLEGDETMLYRLFSNLLTNALKFTREGKIEMKSEKRNGNIRVSLTDTGIGLEPEDLQKVFDRFFQKTPATQGMGIGLAISREIVSLHGGRIWVESTGLGKGTTFIVEFPS